jgi:hypothetical protein
VKRLDSVRKGAGASDTLLPLQHPAEYSPRA